MAEESGSHDVDPLTTVISKAKLQNKLADHLLNAVLEFAQGYSEITTDDLLQVLNLLSKQVRTIHADLWMYGDSMGASPMLPLFSMEEGEEAEAEDSSPPF